MCVGERGTEKEAFPSSPTLSYVYVKDLLEMGVDSISIFDSMGVCVRSRYLRGSENTFHESNSEVSRD